MQWLEGSFGSTGTLTRLLLSQRIESKASKVLQDLISKTPPAAPKSFHVAFFCSLLDEVRGERHQCTQTRHGTKRPFHMVHSCVRSKILAECLVLNVAEYCCFICWSYQRFSAPWLHTATSSPNCHRALGKKHKNITSLCPKKKTSHPRSRCKSWRCGPRPWIYPLCWQPLIEPRLIRLMDDLEIEFLKVGAVSRWEDVFTCFAMIAVFVVRKMWSQWVVISIWCLFVFDCFCLHVVLYSFIQFKLLLPSYGSTTCRYLNKTCHKFMYAMTMYDLYILLTKLHA